LQVFAKAELVPSPTVVIHPIDISICIGSESSGWVINMKHPPAVAYCAGVGLGISFEMPILIFFLAMFGIVSPRFLWKNFRYAILAVFIVAAVICPSPDPWTMCIYAMPMLALYALGIGIAWWVHPSRRRGKEAQV